MKFRIVHIKILSMRGVIWSYILRVDEPPKYRGTQRNCSTKYPIFSKIFCWLGDLELIIHVWNDSVAGK